MPTFKVIKPILQKRRALAKGATVDLPDSASTSALVRTGFIELAGKSPDEPSAPAPKDKGKGGGK